MHSVRAGNTDITSVIGAAARTANRWAAARTSLTALCEVLHNAIGRTPIKWQAGGRDSVHVWFRINAHVRYSVTYSVSYPRSSSSHVFSWHLRPAFPATPIDPSRLPSPLSVWRRGKFASGLKCRILFLPSHIACTVNLMPVSNSTSLRSAVAVLLSVRSTCLVHRQTMPF